jgi:histidinol phosphatase-like PHP family hydrolase
MIDFHTHTLLSDGSLLPSELVNRAIALGYRALAVTDHADASNLEVLLAQLKRFCASHDSEKKDLAVIPGIELTHIPPDLIPSMVEEARRLGAKVVLCHGETTVEPVPPGTNMAAIKAGVDVLTHPGLVTEEECRLAARNSVFFEITFRQGHCLANGHVASMAKNYGVGLLVNTDAHGPGDLITEETALKVAQGAGLTETDFEEIKENAKRLLERVCP